MNRLLFVSHEMTLSGAPIQLAYLVQWLRARGWKTTVVTPEPGPLAAMLDGVEVIYESQLLIDPTYGALRRLAPQFDLVIANTVATWEAVQASHLERVPVLWYIHETQVGVQLMELIHMIEPSLELADTVVTPTHATMRIYERFRSTPFRIVPYGIPEVGKSAKESGDILRCITIGTYERRKGQDVLLEALRSLASQVSFTMAGRILETDFYAALVKEARELGSVQLLGDLGHDAAMQLLAAADVLVLPSRDETMPIVLLEAMSLGKPIICTRVGGIEESIRDGENGLLVPREDARALGAAITRMCDDRELRTRLGRAARETYERHFTIDRYGEQFAAVIRETIPA